MSPANILARVERIASEVAAFGGYQHIYVHVDAPTARAVAAHCRSTAETYDTVTSDGPQRNTVVRLSFGNVGVSLIAGEKAEIRVMDEVSP